jgi:hypothetical protein
LPQLSGAPGATPSFATGTIRNRALLCIIASVGIGNLAVSLAVTLREKGAPLPGENIDAIDLGLGPDVLLAEPPSKVARPVPSPAAEENPTTVDWPPRDSSGRVDHENITLRFR